jgi:preprotein translocase subunit SecB
MKAAPINLVEYFATDLTVSANRNFTADKPTEVKAGEFTVEVQNQPVPTPDANRRWQVTLEIKHQAAADTNFPYAFRLVLVGFFLVEDRVKVENEGRTVKIHGASVLYGMAREITRAMTCHGPHRAVMLPTVSFYETATEPPPKA